MTDKRKAEEIVLSVLDDGWGGQDESVHAAVGPVGGNLIHLSHALVIAELELDVGPASKDESTGITVANEAECEPSPPGPGAFCPDLMMNGLLAEGKKTDKRVTSNY